MSDEAQFEDRYRWCVYCGTDCWEDEPEHGPDCPSTTGLWPVEAEHLGPLATCPKCAHEWRLYGMTCAECGVEFKEGDLVAHQTTDRDDVVVIVCLGCRVLHPSSEASA